VKQDQKRIEFHTKKFVMRDRPTAQDSKYDYGTRKNEVRPPHCNDSHCSGVNLRQAVSAIADVKNLCAAGRRL
jgi:hypothetical protein